MAYVVVAVRDNLCAIVLCDRRCVVPDQVPSLDSPGPFLRPSDLRSSSLVGFGLTCGWARHADTQLWKTRIASNAQACDRSSVLSICECSIVWSSVTRKGAARLVLVVADSFGPRRILLKSTASRIVAVSQRSTLATITLLCRPTKLAGLAH